MPLQKGERLKGQEAQLFWDGYGLRNEGSGIFQYALQLQGALAKLQVNPTLVFLGKYPPHPKFQLPRRSLAEGVRSFPFLPAKIAWNIATGKHLGIVKPKPPAIYHGLSNFNLPMNPGFFSAYKTVISIHDLIPFQSGSGVSQAYRWQLAYCLKRILPQVHRVLCNSRWTENAVLERYPVCRGKTTVIELGFPPLRTWAAKTPLSHTRLLCVSRFETYKRIPFLLQLLRRAPDRMVLTLVSDDSGYRWCQENASDLLTKGRLRLETRVSDQVLSGLYENHDVYVHPSLYEGYGLPATEAISHFLPVVYCQGSALDDVCGQSVATPLGRDKGVDEWLSAITRAYQLSQEPHFPDLVKNFHATRPTWDFAASRLLELYDNLLTDLY